LNLDQYIRDVKDHPKKGIVFKDITPLLKHADSLNYAANALVELVKNKKIDKVVGMESRGFLFAPIIARELKAGFVPVRKKGKLPSAVISQTYSLEYGTDVLEIHVDSITKGDKVLIHDDVLATGGTAEAVCKLVEKLGGEIVQCNFLIELDFLEGNKKLKGYPVSSLLHY